MYGARGLGESAEWPVLGEPKICRSDQRFGCCADVRMARSPEAGDMTAHDLHDTLDELVRSNSDSNPAFDRLLDDYTGYHVVLVVVGGFFLAAIALFSVMAWTRFRRAPRLGSRRWTFERATYFWFAMCGTVISVMMAVIVAANVSTVLEPRQGFAGSLGMLRTPAAGTRTDTLYQAFNTWLQDGDSSLTSPVQSAIDDRLAWQRPKAAICSVLLVLFVWLSVRVWRTLIHRSRAGGRRTVGERALVASGLTTVMVSLVLMLMVIGNTQASFAPLGLTLFNG